MRGHVLPLVGIAAYYRCCVAGGLVYTDGFDDLPHADFEALGMKVASVNDDIYAGFRTIPAFARHALPQCRPQGFKRC